MAEAEEDEQFPGLNKRHGFFKVIEKNQTARGEFHQKQEEWLEQRRQNVESQVRQSHIWTYVWDPDTILYYFCSMYMRNRKEGKKEERD